MARRTRKKVLLQLVYAFFLTTTMNGKIQRLLSTCMLFAPPPRNSWVWLSLHSLMQNVLKFETAVIYADNAHCIRYIGDSTRYDIEPSSDDGWKLYPLILHVRAQVLQLQNKNKCILVKKLPREQNVMDSMARACMRYERSLGWPHRTRIPRIDAVPGLLECIHQVSVNSKMMANRMRISRSIDGIA